jgi:hypothetical protein
VHTDPGQSARHGLAMSPDRSRMRVFVQIVGGVVLGLGLAVAVGLDPGLIFAGYTLGLGALLLCLGLLLPEAPDAVAGRHDRSCPAPAESPAPTLPAASTAACPPTAPPSPLRASDSRGRP